MSPAQALHDAADRLARLSPSHRDPFRFHEDKSELVHLLRMLAKEMDGQGAIAFPQFEGMRADPVSRRREGGHQGRHHSLR